MAQWPVAVAEAECSAVAAVAVVVGVVVASPSLQPVGLRLSC